MGNDYSHSKMLQLDPSHVDTPIAQQSISTQIHMTCELSCEPGTHHLLPSRSKVIDPSQGASGYLAPNPVGL